MSSDVEKGANNESHRNNESEAPPSDENVNVTKESTRRTPMEYVRDNWPIYVKVVELILCVAALVFACEPVKTTGLGASHMHHVGVMYTAYTGYILIICVLLLGRYMGDHLAYKTSMIFSVSGAALFLVAATLLISTHSHLTRTHIFHPHAYLMVMLMTSIIIAFANALVFIIDAVFTFRRQEAL